MTDNTVAPNVLRGTARKAFYDAERMRRLRDAASQEMDAHLFKAHEACKQLTKDLPFEEGQKLIADLTAQAREGIDRAQERGSGPVPDIESLEEEGLVEQIARGEPIPAPAPVVLPLEDDSEMGKILVSSKVAREQARERVLQAALALSQADRLSEDGTFIDNWDELWRGLRKAVEALSEPLGPDDLPIKPPQLPPPLEGDPMDPDALAPGKEKEIGLVIPPDLPPGGHQDQP